ncbi:MAG: RICIN domain-containing protein [Lachnospiraceae bacterium]|nr:RICIN domain-containing protein [Lachnospiraceae bacterium]
MMKKNWKKSMKMMLAASLIGVLSLSSVSTALAADGFEPEADFEDFSLQTQITYGAVSEETEDEIDEIPEPLTAEELLEITGEDGEEEAEDRVERAAVQLYSASVIDAKASDMVKKARSFEGRTGSSVGVDTSRDWCVRFVKKCAGDLGMTLGYSDCVGEFCREAIDGGNAMLYAFDRENDVDLYDASSNVTDVSRSDFTPKPGDLICFLWYGESCYNGNYDHIGIVTEVSGDNVTWIEGNSSAGDYTWIVSHTKDRKSYDYIAGYLRPDYKAEQKNEGMKEGAGRTVPDGEYQLVCGMDSHLALDVPAGAQAKGNPNAQIYHNIGDKNQVFQVTYQGDGFYRIIYKATGKSLDVAGASTEKGANVQFYTSNGSAAQLWSVRSAGDGCYTLQAKCSGLYLDVDSGLAQDGQNVQLWDGNGTNAQKWKFEQIKDNSLKAGNGQTVKNGNYRLVTALAPDMALDIYAAGAEKEGSNASIYHNTKDRNQIFTITHVCNGFYKIVHKATGKALDVYAASGKEGANVQFYPYNGSAAQLWSIIPCADGTYRLQAKCSGLTLDVSGGVTADGQNVQQWNRNDSKAQQWKLVKVK